MSFLLANWSSRVGKLIPIKVALHIDWPITENTKITGIVIFRIF